MASWLTPAAAIVAGIGAVLWACMDPMRRRRRLALAIAALIFVAVGLDVL